MRTDKLVLAFAVAVAASATLNAATRTWAGGTGTKVWSTASNWSDSTVPGDGDTAYFPDSGTVKFTSAVTLPSNIVFNIKGSVQFTGTVSGSGGVTRSGNSGNLYFYGTANTYTGPTTVSSKTFYFKTLANIGTACSVGKPTTAENATLTINNVAKLNGGGSYTTDRPIVLGGSSQFFVDGVTSLTVNGPYSGKGYTRGTGYLTINTYLDADSLNNCSRTDKGTTYFTCPTNAFTCDISIADGFFQGATLANSGQPCAFGAGSAISMGQFNWETIGTLVYNGTTDATCDRAITINGFKNSTATTRHTGGRFRNDTAGTCITLNGTLTQKYNGAYPQSTPALFLSGAGDGVFTAPLTGRTALHKEGTGTWAIKGANTASGLVAVEGGRLDVDGSIAAACEVDAKVTVESGATLGGTGTVYGTTAVLAGGTLAAGSQGAVGKLTLADTSIADGTLLSFKFADGTNDLIVIDGTATFGGAVTVDVSLLGISSIEPGTYALMTWPDGTAPTSVTMSETIPDGTSVSLEGNTLYLTMVDSKSLTWKGGGSEEATWDTTSANWLAGETESVFADLDFVTFTDAGSNSPTVRIDGVMQPSAVVVDADTTAYSFIGAGGITGFSSFTKSGSGTLTVSTSNSYTKATTVEAGTFVLDGTLDGSSINVAHGATFNQTTNGVIAGEDVDLTFGYGTHYLRGDNTFTGTVTFDTRDNGISNAANAYLHLSGSNALGNATAVRVYGYNPNNNHFPNVSLLGDTFITGKTLIIGSTPGYRNYLFKPAGEVGAAGWHGDIEIESDSGNPDVQIMNWSSATLGALEVGLPGGTNEIRGTPRAFNFRGSGPIECYSRINIPGIGVNRNDNGTVTLYATNSVYNGLTVTQGKVKLGVANVLPSTIKVALGKNSEDNSFSTLDLDGFDLTIAGIQENNTGYLSHRCYVMTPNDKPATLTLSGSSACAWGSSHSWMQGPISLVKSGSFTWTLNGTNTFTGATTVESGTLTLNSAQALGGTTNLVLTGGTVLANASGALNEDGTITVPDPASGTLSLADDTTQVVEFLIVNGRKLPPGTYSKEKAGTTASLAFLAGGTGSGTLVVRKGSGNVIYIR